MTPLRTVLTRAAVTTTTRRAGVLLVPGRDQPAAAGRALHRSAAARQPYKDDMDRESLKPKAHENTQGGTDDEVAQDADAAFDPDKTDPDSERAAAAAESSGSGSPLEQSPANKDFASQTTGAKEDRSPGGAGDPAKPSARGGAPKKGKV